MSNGERGFISDHGKLEKVASGLSEKEKGRKKKQKNNRIRPGLCVSSML